MERDLVLRRGFGGVIQMKSEIVKFFKCDKRALIVLGGVGVVTLPDGWRSIARKLGTDGFRP